MEACKKAAEIAGQSLGTLRKVLNITEDGPHQITDTRRWLARQLLDSQNSDDEAFGIVAHHPSISAQA